MVVGVSLQWVENWLSQPRFDRYLIECNGDEERALQLYEWNIRVGHAFLRDASHFEIALRNAYDQAIMKKWHHRLHWLLDPSSPVRRPLWRTVKGKRLDVNAPNRSSIFEAIRKAGGKTATPNRLVSQLSFGFWANLADSAHEQDLWIPYLYYAWPKGTARSKIDQVTHVIASLRNRIAHHEPVFTATGNRSLMHVHPMMIQFLCQLNKDVGKYTRKTSSFTQVVIQRP
jgi:hypothetical protein